MSSSPEGAVSGDAADGASRTLSVRTGRGAQRMRDFRKLEVWEKSHQLTLEIYSATSRFPSGETFGLTSQMRRAASSIPANIAEGCGRDSDADFARFLKIAMGSGNELEYFLLLAKDLHYIDGEACEQLRLETLRVKRMLSGLLSRIRLTPEA
jgi:four helix bundle protein